VVGRSLAASLLPPINRVNPLFHFREGQFSLQISSTASTELQPRHPQSTLFSQSPATPTTVKMVHRESRVRTGLSPALMATNVLIWISAVIVMGILSYLISLSGEAGSRVIYMEVIVCLPAVFLHPQRHTNSNAPSLSSLSSSSSPHSSSLRSPASSCCSISSFRTCGLSRLSSPPRATATATATCSSPWRLSASLHCECCPTQCHCMRRFNANAYSFLLFFNVLYDWNYGYRMRRTTAVV
jgi:hypothetical protein